MKNIYRAISLLLCVGILFALCACGQEKIREGRAEISEAYSEGNISEAGTGLTEVQVETEGFLSYQAVAFPLPMGMDVATTVRILGDTVYLNGNSFDSGEMSTIIFMMDLDGNILRTYRLPAEYSGLTDMYPCADGSLWIMTSVWSEDQNYQGNRFCRLSSEGAVLDEFYIQDMFSDVPYWMLLDETRECLYVIDWHTLYALDYGGYELFRLSTYMGGSFYTPCFTADGHLAVMERSGDKDVVLLLDFEAQTWGENYELAVDGRGLFPGTVEDLYVGDERQLYGMDLSTGILTPLLNWLDTGTNSDVSEVYALADGSYLINAGFTLSFARPFEGESCITLILATLDPVFVEGAVLNFNASQSEYKITVRDYSQYNTSESDTAGLEQLGLDIAAGEVPDIFHLQGIPVSRYAALGLLEDLYPYIDSDPEFDREDIIPSFLSAMEMDGKLYALSPHVCIRTYIAAEGMLSNDWTFSELKTLSDGIDPFAGVLTSYEFLRDMAGGTDSLFVDWDAGTCDFDTQEFIDLLTIASLLPADRRGEYEFSEYEPKLSLDDIQTPLSIMVPTAVQGRETNVYGYPGRDGSRFLLSPTTVSWAISSTSEHKDGAWQFVRMFLSQEWQSSNGIPITCAVFEERIEEEIAHVESGHTIELPSANGTWAEYAFSMDYIEEFEGLVESVTGIYEYDSSLMSIIWSEAQAFFAGDKSAEDAARIIQSRASIYMAEQG